MRGFLLRAHFVRVFFLDSFLYTSLTVFLCFYIHERGHGGRVATLSPPTSEAMVCFPARPQVGKLVVACRWLAVYSTEP